MFGEGARQKENGNIVMVEQKCELMTIKGRLKRIIYSNVFFMLSI
jgi:hypothetical protein